MQGLELSKKYYLTCAENLFRQELGDNFFKLAIGLAGEGSECFGFDDEISSDHDFEPSFCIWLTKEDYEIFGFKLERLYAKLPSEFLGFYRQTQSNISCRRGVMPLDDFYLKFLGSPCAPSSLEQWLSLPCHSLACACNGEVFVDNLGNFSAVRKELLKGYPLDVRLKKIAAHCALMAQSGLYNYKRCIARSENGAAQLCVFQFVKNAISAVYLINNVYQPFYKWAYKGLRNFKTLSELENSLVALSVLGNTPDEAKAKNESMEEICALITRAINEQNLLSKPCDNIEKCAFILQNSIQDVSLRNMHLMDGIE